MGVMLWCMLGKVKASWTYDYLEETNIDPEIPDSFRYGMIYKKKTSYPVFEIDKVAYVH